MITSLFNTKTCLYFSLGNFFLSNRFGLYFEKYTTVFVFLPLLSALLWQKLISCIEIQECFIEVMKLEKDFPCKQKETEDKLERFTSVQYVILTEKVYNFKKIYKFYWKIIAAYKWSWYSNAKKGEFSLKKIKLKKKNFILKRPHQY